MLTGLHIHLNALGGEGKGGSAQWFRLEHIPKLRSPLSQEQSSSGLPRLRPHSLGYIEISGLACALPRCLRPRDEAAREPLLQSGKKRKEKKIKEKRWRQKKQHGGAPGGAAI